MFSTHYVFIISAYNTYILQITSYESINQGFFKLPAVILAHLQKKTHEYNPIPSA